MFSGHRPPTLRDDFSEEQNQGCGADYCQDASTEDAVQEYGQSLIGSDSPSHVSYFIPQSSGVTYIVLNSNSVTAERIDDTIRSNSAMHNARY